ncbi:MAG: sodium-dependent transporter [Clostridia bacterium]|nr:sodium-dependent transporter [Clostridia bacterium]NCC43938.1 sodium-dependent transporter [Clostridia bacterium]
MEKRHKNGSFSSSMGFILACVGSAVGLGNIWMFPYRTGQYGGGAFLIPYLLFIVLFGYAGLSAEFGIGRKARTGTLGSYELCWKQRKIKGKDLGKVGKILGWIPLLGSLGIAIGYSVIVGWVFRFLSGSLTGKLYQGDTTGFFSQATGNFGSLPWHFLVIGVAVLLLITGSTKQIEWANRIMMPVFFLLFAVLALRVAFLPGAMEGYRFLFIPKWENLAKVDTWVMAMGQAFFSLSITGSGMIVYGSYLGKHEDITKASMRTALFDTMAAMLAALAIMPAVFAFGIEPTSGPPLMFITIPAIFEQMPMGRLFSVIFFLSVAFAGITSLINMFEAVVESWQYHFKMGRRLAVSLCGIIVFGVGVFLEEEMRLGTWMDFITIIVTPFGAVLGAVSIYYILGLDKITEEINEGRKRPVSKVFGWIGKYFYVPLAIIVFILGLVYKGIG